MTVSTKNPSGRTGGATTSNNHARPIAAPRVVNNRRIRTGGVLLGVLLLLLGAALSGVALLSATKTSAYLAIRTEVQVGSTISAADLKTVQLSGGQGLSAIPASQINTVVGRYASATLLPGTLLAPGQLTTKPLRKQGDALVRVRAIALPPIKPGDQIGLVPPTTGGTGAAVAPGTTQYLATVIDVGKRGSDGAVLIDVAVDSTDAGAIASYTSNFGIVLKSQD
jgi:hypothetical protein